VVVAGHTLDDQAETVLLHLIRGSGLDGLAGMRPRSAWPIGRGPEVARPLLALRREETGRYCRELGIEPREDPTNELLLATRNRVRHEVLPVLRTLNSRVDEALVRLADSAAEDAEALDGLAADAVRGAGRLRKRKGAFELGIEALGQLRPAIRARAVRLALSRVLRSEGDIEAAHVQALDRLVDSRPGRASLAHGLVAVRDSRSLTIYRGEADRWHGDPETPWCAGSQAGG
jgi:tRNA(Ile)-lysidine synthase